MSPIRQRVKGLAIVHHGRIRPNPLNWRLHPDAQREALLGIFDDVGVIEAVLVVPVEAEALASLALIKRGDVAGFAKWLKGYGGDFLLVDGHLRVDTLGQHGDGMIDVLILDLSASESAEVLFVKDPIAGMAGKSLDKLRDLARDFNSTNPAIAALMLDIGGATDAMKARVAAVDLTPPEVPQLGAVLQGADDDDGPPPSADPSETPAPTIDASGNGQDQAKLGELRFGSKRMLMTQEDVAVLDKKIAKYVHAHGTLHGLAKRMIDGLVVDDV